MGAVGVVSGQSLHWLALWGGGGRPMQITPPLRHDRRRLLAGSRHCFGARITVTCALMTGKR